MAIFSHLPLQKAIYQALTDDVTTMAMITGVYDRPPQGTGFPYITIGESTLNDWSSVVTSGMEQVISIHIWSRNGGRQEAISIMERVYILLHDADLNVDGQSLVLLRFASSAVILEDDGYTYQATMRFRALLEANS